MQGLKEVTITISSKTDGLSFEDLEIVLEGTPKEFIKVLIQKTEGVLQVLQRLNERKD